MVARVAAEEAQPGRRSVGGPAHELRRQPHRVTQREAEHIAVKVQSLGVVAGGQHHVAQALLPGDELVPVRADHAAVLQGRAVEDLQRVARRDRRRRSSRRRGGRPVPRRWLLCTECLRRRVRYGSLAALRHSRIPSRPPPAGRAHRARSPSRAGKSSIRRYSAPSVAALALDHAEDLQPVLTPGGHIGGLDPQIAQRANAVIPHLRGSRSSAC